MDAVFPAAAFLIVLLGTQRSLGLGFVTLIGAGYFNGIIRANYLGIFTTFMFDCAVLGLYVGCLIFPRGNDHAGIGVANKWTVVLIGWPLILSLLPVNDFLIQLVALRATVWFLPVMLIAIRLTSADLATLARGLALLNLIALAVGIYIYFNGVQSLYPENAVTQIIYLSKDVAGHDYYRIPATFLSAHAYGGAMLFTLPFLLDRAFGSGVQTFDRSLAVVGIVAAIVGILMCAARQPIVTFSIATLITWACTRFNPMVGLVAIGLVVAGVVFSLADERLQRASNLEDTEAVSERVSGSANDSFLELIVEHPTGAGMGSSVGTSIPFFLSNRAPEAVGLENEFCRILIDQGWIGLAAWLAFLVWLLSKPPALKLQARWGLGVVLMYALTLTNWATSFIGTGTLSAIPMSTLLLLQMGVLIRVRETNTPKLATSSFGGSN